MHNRPTEQPTAPMCGRGLLKMLQQADRIRTDLKPSFLLHPNPLLLCRFALASAPQSSAAMQVRTCVDLNPSRLLRRNPLLLCRFAFAPAPQSSAAVQVRIRTDRDSISFTAPKSSAAIQVRMRSNFKPAFLLHRAAGRCVARRFPGHALSQVKNPRQAKPIFNRTS